MAGYLGTDVSRKVRLSTSRRSRRSRRSRASKFARRCRYLHTAGKPDRQDDKRYSAVNQASVEGANIWSAKASSPSRRHLALEVIPSNPRMCSKCTRFCCRCPYLHSGKHEHAALAADKAYEFLFVLGTPRSPAPCRASSIRSNPLTEQRRKCPLHPSRVTRDGHQ